MHDKIEQTIYKNLFFTIRFWIMKKSNWLIGKWKGKIVKIDEYLY